MTDGTNQEPSATSREWNAAAYHRLSEPQFGWGLRVLERLRLQGNEHVLDAGCGSGRLTRELARRLEHGTVTGVDLSENMARTAAATLGKDTGRAVVCGDLCLLPFRDSAFDVAFSTATFHWILDHDRLFRELRRVLRPSGRVEAQCGGGPNLAAVHARADALAGQPQLHGYFEDWRDPWLFPSVADGEERLRRAGFGSVQCWLESAPTPFPSAERYRAFLESVVMRPYLMRLPHEAERDAFLDALVRQAGNDDPPFTLDYWRLNISATT